MDSIRNPHLTIRRRVVHTRVVTQADFDRFAVLSGDDNPIHVDPVFCASTRFGKTLCHGMLLYSILSHVITSELIPGGVELEQDLKFPGPTYAGDALTVVAEIVSIDRALGTVEVQSRITGPDDGIGCEGRTLVSAHV